MKTQLITTLLFFGFVANAQTNLSVSAITSAGGSAQGGSYTLDAAVGQSSPVGASSNGGYTFAGGFIPAVTGGATLPPAPATMAATRISDRGFTANWYAVAGTSHYLLDVSTDLFATFVIEARDVGGSTSYVVTGLLPDTLYYYRVRATNAVGASEYSNVIEVRTYRTYPTTLSLARTYTYMSLPNLSDYQSEDYQLIGLPGNSSRYVSDFLEPGQQGTVWEVYRDNGIQSYDPKAYYERFSVDSRFLCSTGKGFWVLHRGNWTIPSTSINAAPLDTATWEVTISFPDTLRRFYLITNPFDLSVSWDSIASSNGIRDSIRGWDGFGWFRSYELTSYDGYLFFNGRGHSAIHIPWRLTSPALTRLQKQVADVPGWRIDVVVRQGKFQDRTTSLGVSPSALIGMDDFEQRKPRAMAGIPDALFKRPEWDPVFSEFATDIRPGVADIEEWEMTVRSSDRKEVSLSFQGIHRVPEQFAVYLIDRARARAVNLRENSLYNFVPSTKITAMSVVVGKPELVQEKLKGLLPTRFELLANYPNPFNPSTTIPIAIPIQSEVTLDVYNVLGQHVRRLREGPLEPGRYYFEWDGSNDAGVKVASGVYFARMRARGHADYANKMLLLK
jgi:hypothetical protein